MSKLEQIQSFIAVADGGSFIQAAKYLNISPAALSRQILQLEQTLGVTLIARTTRHLHLTDAGQAYLDQVRPLIEALSAAEKDLQKQKVMPRGVLRVTCVRYFAEQSILPKLAAFTALYPELYVHLELAERFPNLLQENVDIVYGVTMAGPDHLVQKRVGNTRYVLCASPAYLERNGTPTRPADLQQHLYITHSMRQPDNLIQLSSGPVAVKPTLALNDSRAICACAVNGMGIAQLHDYVVQDALQAGQLVPLLTSLSPPQTPIYLYYRQQPFVQPKIRCFIDFFVSH